MAVSVGAARFRQGAGRLCLDFIRTLRHRGTPEAAEELVDLAALAAWVSQCGPCPADPSAPTATRPGDAHHLREAISTLIDAARSPAGVASCPAPARDRVNHAATRP